MGEAVGRALLRRRNIGRAATRPYHLFRSPKRDTFGTNTSTASSRFSLSATNGESRSATLGALVVIPLRLLPLHTATRAGSKVAIHLAHPQVERNCRLKFGALA